VPWSRSPPCCWRFLPRLPSGPRGTLVHLLLLVLVAAAAWLAVCVVRVAEDALMRRYNVDYTTPVEEVRAEFERVLAASKLWNEQTAVLQVVDATEHTMVLRALVSADSAPNARDLRCEVRERLLAWLQRQHPEELPRVRAELETPVPGSPAAGVSPSDGFEAGGRQRS